MEKPTKIYDVIVIGGGAAGIMSAIFSKKSHPDQSVLIVDRTFALGRKILVSGAGRCNLTNINLKDHYQKHYYCDDPALLDSVFEKFGYKDLMRFFEDLGIETYIETKTNIGKVFPITDSAKNVVAILEDEVKRLEIEVKLNTTITDIQKQGELFTLQLDNGNSLSATKVVVSVGGKTYPALGSDGSLYKVLQKLGHTILEPVPAAVPLVSKNRLCHLLQGAKINAEVTSVIDGKNIKSDVNDVIFTQYGLSGSAILNISRDISIHINRNSGRNAEVILNFFPNKNTESALEYMQARWLKRPAQSIRNSFLGIIPIKIIDSLLEVLGIDANKQVNKFTNEQKFNLINNLSRYKFDISGTRGWNEAEFTAGGIPASEIYHDSQESKIIKGLYFAGEVINCDGDIGGYNISWAFCSGALF